MELQNQEPNGLLGILGKYIETISLHFFFAVLEVRDPTLDQTTLPSSIEIRQSVVALNAVGDTRQIQYYCNRITSKICSRFLDTRYGNNGIGTERKAISELVDKIFESERCWMNGVSYRYSLSRYWWGRGEGMTPLNSCYPSEVWVNNWRRNPETRHLFKVTTATERFYEYII